MLNIIVPQDKSKVLRQIKALEYQIEQDTREKDKQIHRRALETLQKSIKK